MWSNHTNRGENERILAKLPRRYLHQQQQRIQSENNYDHLLVFGYQCKLYRDDDKARSVNSGQQLIPWMNNDQLMIDRYDVRGHLHDLSMFEPKNYKKQTLTPEEIKLEEELNEARFADLKYDDSDDDKEKMNDGDGEDENNEIDEAKKRFAGNCIPFNYDENSNSNHENDEKIENDDSFKLPDGVEIPDGLILPESSKLAAVIEKTAEFVSKQNAQMEILLKAKQSSNPNFDFLSVDSELYPFYKFILQEIKNGNWPGINGKLKKTENKKNVEDCSKIEKNIHSPELGMNSDSDSDHYLHPSLLSSMPKKSSEKKSSIPKIHDSKGGDSKYSRVVKELKSKYSFSDDEDSNDDEDEDSNDAKIKSKSSKINNNNCDNSLDFYSNIPEDTKKIIEKLAESVAKNGDKFETSIRTLNNPKFDFLITNHEHHHFYIERKIHHFKIAKLKELKLNITKKKTAFSLASKNEPKPLDRSAAAILDEEQVKEKTIQNIRKQKAAEFLKSLKNKNSETSSECNVIKPNNSSQEPKVFGPELPQVNLDPVLSDDEMIEKWIENLDKPNKKDEKTENILDDLQTNEELQTPFKRKNRSAIRRERKVQRSRSRSESPIQKNKKFSRSRSRSPLKNNKKLPYKIKETIEIESQTSKEHEKEDEKIDENINEKESHENIIKLPTKDEKETKTEDMKITINEESINKNRNNPKNKEERNKKKDEIRKVDKKNDEKIKKKSSIEDKKASKRERHSRSRSRSKSYDDRSHKISSSSHHQSSSSSHRHRSSPHRNTSLSSSSHHHKKSSKHSSRHVKKKHRNRSYSDSDSSKSRSRSHSPSRSSHRSRHYR